ncbi:hypothetical protein FRC11_007631 [Ceratobasidium sp. 423]|nr:hypothetical protein FRC11_007631 [Ceratobasidium sp. 423]
MSLAKTPCDISGSFRGTVVDLVVKSSAATQNGQLPAVRELISHLDDLGSVLFVYHQFQEENLAKFSHVYIVFKTHLDADGFVETWQIWDDDHPLKAEYAVQNNLDPSPMLLYYLQFQVERIPRVASSEGPRMPPRLAGLGFILSGPVGLGHSSLPASLREEHSFFKNMFINEEVSLVELEEMVRVVQKERDEYAKKAAELRREVEYYNEKLGEYHNP